MTSDDLPGMWEWADLVGGETDAAEPVRGRFLPALPNGTPADDLHHLVNADARSAWRREDEER